MALKAGEILVGLDIGTTKICAVVGEITEEGGIDIIAVGQSPSDGLRGGVVINIEKTVNSIRRAIDEAEKMATMEIHEVVVGVAGSHIASFNNRGQVPVRNRNEICQADIDRVLDYAATVKLPEDQEIIHVLPQQFTVDEQEGIQDPLGMNGVRLEADVHIVTGQTMAIRNLVKCCEGADLVVAALVLEPLASAEAVLNADEREIVVGLLDIGGGTTDLAVFYDHCIQHTYVLPLGGNHMSADLASGLRTSISDASRIKEQYGSALAAMEAGEEVVEVPAVGGGSSRTATREYIASILEPRAHEMMDMVRVEIDRMKLWNYLSGGIVLTGGASQLKHLAQLAEDVFDLAVRVGRPRGVGGLAEAVSDPRYATGVGLVIFAARNNSHGRRNNANRLVEKMFKGLRSIFGRG